MRSAAIVSTVLAALLLVLTTDCSDDNDTTDVRKVNAADGGSLELPDGGSSTLLDSGVATGCGAAGCTITFASGIDWDSFEGDLTGVNGGTVGASKLVCLSATAPANCPAGAVVEGSSGTGWTAQSRLVPSAKWIWRGDLVPTQTSDNVFAVFEKRFVLGVRPSGSIEIAADDFVEVLVNGAVVGTNGSVTSESDAFAAQSTVKKLDLAPKLVPGENKITIVGQNGPASYAGCSGSCTYAANTAGVLFGGVLVSFDP